MGRVRAMPGGQRRTTGRSVRSVRRGIFSPPRAIARVRVPFFFLDKFSLISSFIVCSIGCSSCASNTGNCLSCSSPNFTQDENDSTQCTAVQQTTSSGTPCPDGSFSDGNNCTACSASCQTCNGATSSDCIVCKEGTYLSSGNCVSADANGVCEGGGLIADNNKKECDSGFYPLSLLL